MKQQKILRFSTALSLTAIAIAAAAVPALAIAGPSEPTDGKGTGQEEQGTQEAEYTGNIRDLYLSDNPSRSWGDWSAQRQDALTTAGMAYRNKNKGDTFPIWRLTPEEEARMRAGQAYYREGLALEQKRRWKDGKPPEQRLISEIEASLTRFLKPTLSTESKELPLAEEKAKRAALQSLNISRESDVKTSPLREEYLRRKQRNLWDVAPPSSPSEQMTFARWKSQTLRRLEKIDAELTMDLFRDLQSHVSEYKLRFIEAAREGANGLRSAGGEQIAELGSPVCGNLLDGLTEISPIDRVFHSPKSPLPPGSNSFIKRYADGSEETFKIAKRSFVPGAIRFLARRADGSEAVLEITLPGSNTIFEPADLLKNLRADLRATHFPAIAALEDYENRQEALWRLHTELERAPSQERFQTALAALKSEVHTRFRRSLPSLPTPEIIGIKYGALKDDPLFWIKREMRARQRGAPPISQLSSKGQPRRKEFSSAFQKKLREEVEARGASGERSLLLGKAMASWQSRDQNSAARRRPLNDLELKDHPSPPEERYRISGSGTRDFVIASRMGLPPSTYLNVPAVEEAPASPTALAMRSRGAMPLASSFLPLPTPERHWIQGLSLRSGDGKLLEPGVDYTVHDTQDQSAYYVRFLAGRRPERVSVEARFEPMPEGEWPGLPPDFDPRLLEIAPSRLHESIRLLREAGFADLSTRLAGLALRAEERRRPISIPEVEAEFARSGRYSFVPEGPSAAPNPINPFSEYSNLVHEGRLCAQCNGFEPVLTALLNQIFKDQPRIRFSSMVTIRSRSRLPGLKQQLDPGWISHQRTTLLIDGVTSAVLDGTAGQMDPRNPFRWRNTWLARMLTQREIGRPRFMSKRSPSKSAGTAGPPERSDPGTGASADLRALANAAVIRHASSLENSRSELFGAFKANNVPGRDLTKLKSVYALVDVKRQYILGNLDEAGARERLKRFFGEQAVEPIRDPQSLLGFVRAKAQELELYLDGLDRQDPHLVERKLPWLASSSRELFGALEKLQSPEDDVTPLGVAQHRAFAQGARHGRAPGECLRDTLLQEQGSR